MVYAVFTDEMRRLLRSVQGKRLLRYEWAEEPYSRHEAYGNLRLDLEDGAIEIENLQKPVRFLYKGIIIKHNKTEPTYTKTSLFLCEKRRFFMGRTEKGGKVF